MPNAIEFDHVSKQYRLGLVSTKTLSHDIRRFWLTNILGKEDPYLKIGETNDRASKGSSDYVWALKDITFNVEQGDVVGIIGKNGAGKSTLLKLLSRVTGPTTGQIRAHGRIGSLLEVGTGFHQEMTGRENIFMNGAILGMTRSEIQRKLDEIVDFSGCERYIDTPVKRYSSGMMVRLGFAVAAHLDPEILVVDEVLAVGDAEFQKKAIGKMQDVSKGEGRTVLFVSHNMASIKQLCKSGILLKNGAIEYMDSNINKVVDRYIGEGAVCGNRYFEDIMTAPGNDNIRIKSLEVLAADGSEHIDISTGILFRMRFMCYKENAMVDACFAVSTLDDIDMFSIGQFVGHGPIKDSKKGMYTVEFMLPPFSLNARDYKVEVHFGENQTYDLFSGYEQQFRVENNMVECGFNHNIPRGYLRPQKNFKFTFEGEKW